MIIYRKEGLFNYCGWPTIAKDENGILYTVFSGNRIGHVCPFGKNLMVVSYDDGETWSEPIIVNDSSLDDRDTGILCRKNGKKVLSWFCHSASFYMDYYSEVLRTVKKEKLPLADGAIEVWKTLNKKETEGGSYIKFLDESRTVKSPVSAPHGPIELSDGRLLYVGKEFHWNDLEKGAIYACTYDGKWEVLSKIEMPVPLNLVHEPHAIELDNGDILAAFRVHNETSFTVYLSRSSDGGKTWSTPYNTGFNGSPPHLMRHSSGAIVLSYARREEPYYECARVSNDNGNTWSEEYILSYSRDNDIGYPSTVELSDGSLLTVYYQRYENDENTSVLATKWSIKDGKDS